MSSREDFDLDGADFTDAFDLNAVLHPASVFSHPREVVRDTALSLQEKRAILSAWASDVCAVESVPELRCAPGAAQSVRFDDIIDALQSLDPPAAISTTRTSPRKPGRCLPLRRFRRGSGSDAGGLPGCSH